MLSSRSQKSYITWKKNIGIAKIIRKKPILDEQKINQINLKLQLALHDNLTYEVKYFKKHGFQMIRGKIKSTVAGDCLIFDDIPCNVLELSIMI
jgi:hypothetical protein